MGTGGVGVFQEAVQRMANLLADLQAAHRERVADYPHIPAGPGIYLFSERDQPIYVGQSRNPRSRRRQHMSERCPELRKSGPI